MATKLPGKHIQLRLPVKTNIGLERICNALGVKSTQLINIIIYASEDFNCTSHIQDFSIAKSEVRKVKKDLRMGPYAEHIVIEAAKRNNVFAGTWIKKLLIEKVKEWQNGRNIFDGRKLSKNQLIS